MEHGYLVFRGVECIYTKTDDYMYLIPRDKDRQSELFQYAFNKNFMIEFTTSIYKRCYAYVENCTMGLDNSLKLQIKYFVRLIDNEGFNSMEMTGDDIDIFFSPSSYFFRRRDNIKTNPIDLIYDNHIANSFEFIYINERIQVDLCYGNILRNGIASDLKLHPSLFIRFPKTNSIEMIYGIYSIIVKFLQLVRHQTDCNLLPTNLYGEIKNKFSRLGVFYERFYQTNYSGTGDAEYAYFEPYINQLLQFIADNGDLNLNYFPNRDYNSFDYAMKRYLTIFAAFEYECRQAPEKYERTSDNEVMGIREELKEVIRNFKQQGITESERKFLDMAYQSISRLGTQFGQKRKIINAYMENEEPLRNSMKYIFLRDYNIQDIASNLVNLRGKIVHSNLYKNLNNEEIMNIRFLDILTYVMMLKRSGIDNDGIELIIGVIFHCNIKYMDYRFSN